MTYTYFLPVHICYLSMLFSIGFIMSVIDFKDTSFKLHTVTFAVWWLNYMLSDV